MEPAVKTKVNILQNISKNPSVTRKEIKVQKKTSRNRLSLRSSDRPVREKQKKYQRKLLDAKNTKAKSYAESIRTQSNQKKDRKFKISSPEPDLFKPQLKFRDATEISSSIKSRTKIKLNIEKRYKPKGYLSSKKNSKDLKGSKKKNSKATINKPISVNLFQNNSPCSKSSQDVSIHQIKDKSEDLQSPKVTYKKKSKSIQLHHSAKKEPPAGQDQLVPAGQGVQKAPSSKNSPRDRKKRRERKEGKVKGSSGKGAEEGCDIIVKSFNLATTNDNIKIPKAKKTPKTSLTIRGKSVGAQLTFGHALNTTQRAEGKQKSFRQKLKNTFIKIKDPKSQEFIEKNIYTLYQKYKICEFEKIYDGLDLSKTLLETIEANNEAIKKANMLSFFFINFYKNFEQNIIHKKPKKAYQECLKLYDQHSVNTLDMNIEEFEKCNILNERILQENPVDNINTCHKKLVSFEQDLKTYCRQIGKNSMAKFKEEEKYNSPKGIKEAKSTDKDLFEIPQKLKETPAFNRKEYNSVSRSMCWNSMKRDGSDMNEQSSNAGYSSLMLSDRGIESKLNRLQEEIGKRVHNESMLKSSIKTLTTELNEVKKLLTHDNEYNDLKESISSISQAIFNTSKDIHIKDEHQMLLKNLIGDDLRERIGSLEEKLKTYELEVEQLQQKMQKEIRRNNQAYTICKKYIGGIKTCHKMAQEDTSIIGFLYNLSTEADEDLEKIDEFHLQSYQNSVILKSYGSKQINSAKDQSIEDMLQKELLEKDKKIHKLEHELKLMSKSKSRAGGKLIRSKFSASHTGNDLHTEESEESKSLKSVGYITGVSNSLRLPMSKCYDKKLRNHYPPRPKKMLNLQDELEQEPDPEPARLTESNGIISEF
ncbi:unnamed protein product [Moneuplotes crassus]|uniref:Uncharacterized protein n=1 Tax=Euplotes crassus TaxID=5936 RepID=A0AAD2D3H2_EUPCR|nr:unnamed protein product [Moneuplotes crassus]